MVDVTRRVESEMRMTRLKKCYDTMRAAVSAFTTKDLPTICAVEKFPHDPPLVDVERERGGEGTTEGEYHRRQAMAGLGDLLMGSGMACVSPSTDACG